MAKQRRKRGTAGDKTGCHGVSPAPVNPAQPYPVIQLPHPPCLPWRSVYQKYRVGSSQVLAGWRSRVPYRQPRLSRVVIPVVGFTPSAYWHIWAT
jgi:hypothetical protein